MKIEKIIFHMKSRVYMLYWWHRSCGRIYRCNIHPVQYISWW